MLKITNSLSKQKEEFRPIEPGIVKIYVCGPTVYDEPHIGHLRSAYVFEVMRNYLKYSKYKVRFARNVTDVDDKIIEKARALGTVDLNAEVANVSRKYFDWYKRDLKRLGIQDPDFEPKATEHIPQMIDMIQKLVDKKIAYVVESGVYFNVNQYMSESKTYGEVSHQDPDRMLEEVKALDANPHKKNALDFALWKKAKEGEPYWDSPWGKGRPGWHIECSAMSLSYFGGTFDIHGGGRDLIFPHHENENAQSQCATGQKFVNTWVHHGLITVAGRKMSKSLKNFITMDEIMKKDPLFGDEILKLTFLGTHYSAPLDYTPERAEMDARVWRKFLEFFDNARQASRNGTRISEKRLPEFYKLFTDAMDNDFNTPEVLTQMHNIIHECYKSKDSIAIVTAAQAIHNFGAEVFSIIFDTDVIRVGEAHIQDEIDRRKIAKQASDYKTADEIRERLLKEKRIELRDLPDGRTIWRAR